MSPAVCISAEISQPNIVARLTENKAQALLSRGDPAGRGAEQSMLEVDRNTSTTSTTSGRNTVELYDVTVRGDCLVNLNLANIEESNINYFWLLLLQIEPGNLPF